MLKCATCLKDITNLKKFEERRYIRGYDTEAKRYKFSAYCVECYPYNKNED